MSLPSYLYSVGGDYEDPSRNLGVNMGIFKALNLADLECPTFGLGLATGADGSVRTTVGPPYLPIIVPPPQALTLDPDWQKQCTGYQSALEGQPGFSFAIFDPPRALTAAGALVPGDPGGGNSPPDVPAMPTKSTPAATDPTLQPQQIPTPDGPKPTSVGDPGSIGSNDPPGDPQTPSPSVDPGGKTGGGSSNGNQGGDIPNQGSQSGVIPNQGNQGGDSSNNGNQGDVPPDQGSQGGDGSKQSSQNVNQNHQPDSDSPGENKANPGNAAPNQASPQSDPPTPNEQNSQSGDGLAGFIVGGLNGGPPQPGDPQNLPAADPATLTVGGQVITANPSNIIVADSTLTPGSPGITVSGKTLSLGNDGNLIVDGNSIPIPYAPLHVSPTVLTVGGQPFTALPNGFAVAGSSVVPGGPPVIVSGTPIALGYSGILTVGSSSTVLPNGPAAPTADVFTVGGQTVTANPTGFAIGSATLSPGGSAVTISGTVISLGPSGALSVGSSSINLLPTPSAVAGPVFTLGGLTFTESSSNVLIDGKTLSAAGPAATVAGDRVSLASDGKLVVGSLTTDLPLSMESGVVFGAGGLVFTEGSSDLIVDGKTIFPGGPPMTVVGTPVSLGSDGRLVIGSLTTSLPTSGGVGAVFTAGGLVFTEGSSDLVVDGKTLFPGGPPMTVAGTLVSLGPDGELIAGSTSTTLPANWGGGSSTPQVFKGAQGRNAIPSFIAQVGIVGLVFFCT